MKKKKTIEEEINLFLEYWDCDAQVSFIRNILHLFELYDVDDEDDWVEREIGGDKEEVRTIRLIRTVYLVSKVAESQGSRLAFIRMNFPNLYKRMEKHGLGDQV